MIVQMMRTSLQSMEKMYVGRNHSRPHAREQIAKRLKIGLGTYERLIRGRVKKIDAELWRRIQAFVIEETEAEIARRTHELEIARRMAASGADRLTAEQMGEIETHVAALVEVLKRGGG